MVETSCAENLDRAEASSSRLRFAAGTEGAGARSPTQGAGTPGARKGEQGSPKRSAAQVAQRAAQRLEDMATAAEKKSSGNKAMAVVECLRSDLRDQGVETRTVICAALRDELQAFRQTLEAEQKEARAALCQRIDELSKDMQAVLESQGPSDLEDMPLCDLDAADRPKSPGTPEGFKVPDMHRLTPSVMRAEADEFFDTAAPAACPLKRAAKTVVNLPGALSDEHSRQNLFDISDLAVGRGLTTALESMEQDADEMEDGRGGKNVSDGTDVPEAGRGGRMGSILRSATILPEKDAQTFRKRFGRIVGNPRFDYGVAAVIVVNAIMVGVQTQFTATHLSEEIPNGLRVIDIIFCAVFTSELLSKLYVKRLDFYKCADWKWNSFDTALVAMQLLEETIAVILSQSKGAGVNFSFMRVLRILRLIRIIRLFRVVKIIGEVRTIVASIAGCMRPLLSAIVLLLLMVYVVGVFFCQVVTLHREENNSIESDEALLPFFGTLPASIFCLYQAILGGADWGDIANPLSEHVGPAYGVVFSLYIAFGCLAMLNVITGCFVEAALASAKRDDDVYMVNHLKELLEVTDADNSGNITWDEFEEALDHPKMVEYFNTIDIDCSEARTLFEIMDLGGAGCVTRKDFVSGCLRLRGPARALDLERFSHTSRKMLVRSAQQLAEVARVLDQLAHRHADATKQVTPLKTRTRGAASAVGVSPDVAQNSLQHDYSLHRMIAEQLD